MRISDIANIARKFVLKKERTMQVNTSDIAIVHVLFRNEEKERGGERWGERESTWYTSRQRARDNNQAHIL